MNQTQTLLRILYRHEKGPLSMIEQAIPPAQMEPVVRKVYDQKAATVAKLKRRLESGKN